MVENFEKNKSNKIQGIQNEVEQVKDTMKTNLQKMYTNVEDVEGMEKKAIELKQGAQDYNSSATKLKRATWWHNCKWCIILIAVFLANLIFLFLNQLIKVYFPFVNHLSIQRLLFLLNLYLQKSNRKYYLN